MLDRIAEIIRELLTPAPAPVPVRVDRPTQPRRD